ncbi:P-loop containing nucleoside triphosphate hydrolase protein [Atractiella rhizophila]|nr:P-loop containing nucleoside triphosphate hydrolase protein [Atractiella rhizophila]
MGRVSNLMSGDTYSVAQRFWDFSDVFTAPVKLTIALIFLYEVLGLASFAGVAVVLLAYLLNYPLARWNIKLTRGMWTARDERMTLVNELITSIRFLKYMGWSSHWKAKVQSARDDELNWRIKQNVLGSAISFIWLWLPSCVVLAAFSTFTVILKQPLTVSKAFVAIQIFSQLQAPMSQLPNEIFALLQAWVSMSRIQAYLQEEEVEDWASAVKGAEESLGSEDGTVGFENASFKWHIMEKGRDKSEVEESFTLGPLDLDFKVGGLNLVSGPIGSGKSSLLSALLGEIPRVQGRVLVDKRNHNVAYAGQQPFLEFASIRENIVFHSRWDEQKYWATVKACALQPDLDMLEDGDMTEVGEKGVQLSGGQRARISLARAIYSQASLILLDDPLASVDMHTARHIFEHCLSPSAPLIAGRTVILVTHHVSLCLPATEYLVEMRDGKVIRKGDVEELKKRGSLIKVIEDEDISEEESGTSSDKATLAANDADEAVNSKPTVAAERRERKKVEDTETQAEGRVNYRTYLLYMKAAGWIWWTLTIILLVLIRLINVGNQFYLAKWTEAYNVALRIVAFFITPSRRVYVLTSDTILSAALPPPSENVTPWILIYLSISMAGAFAALAYIVIGYVSSLRASRVLFTSMLSSVVGSPTRFFDISPTGRLLNRFVSDIRALDDALNNSSRTAISGTFQFLISFGVIVYVIPIFTPFALVIAFMYIYIAPPFVRTARDLRRLESISLSPAFSGFSELLSGLPHIRGYGMEIKYQDRFYDRVDLFQSMDHAYWLAQMWLRYRYDVLGSLVVFMTTLFALWSELDAGRAAVVIVQSGVFADASRQLVKVLAQAELDFNSIERIKEYLDLVQEAPAQRPETRLPAHWPSTSGGIDVENLSVRYSPDLPMVLKGISFSVKPGEKVGVVGRTGSGKSTLAMALLRIVEPMSGRILLDGIDVSTVGLDDLRNAITIISQDVSLFAGTVRSNLDPFDEHEDKEIWDVLRLCHLAPPPSSNPAAPTTKSAIITSLDQPVSAGGASFSAGERQLIALSRAMLRRSGFIILDEASSSIDLDTDNKIQKTIRNELGDTLVLTIAHRLITVADYDRILVLSAGEILEFDTPRNLFANKNSVFRELCMRSADWEALSKILNGS